METKNIEKYNLIADALRYRKIIGELDIKIKRTVNDDDLNNDEFFAYNKENRIIQLDIDVSIEKHVRVVVGKTKEFYTYTLKTNDKAIPLSNKEIDNLMREDTKETTISNLEYRQELKKSLKT